MVNNLPTNVGDVRDIVSIPLSGISLGGGHGNPLQDSCLENPMDRGPLWITVHSVPQSCTRLKRLSTQASFIILNDQIPPKVMPIGFAAFYLTYLVQKAGVVLENM